NELISIREGVGDFASLEVRYILDFSTNRGLTYYSGLIFDISLDITGETVVGGGGRYDGLVRMLGGSEDVPAVGFAINVDSLLSSVTQSSSIEKK
ncbi:MAG: ATP phosphoribosyltransferase regulatory subunit, partial [Chloroflexota bacterium]|nr:ATP phosphoribosyltransferase regulatory subunit [Chloroflexota bacterium]